MGQSRMRDHTGWKTINSAIPAVPEVYLSGCETLKPRPETYQNPKDGQWRIPSSHPSRRHQRRPEQERETLWFFVVCCLRTTDGSAGDFFLTRLRQAGIGKEQSSLERDGEYTDKKTHADKPKGPRRSRRTNTGREEKRKGKEMDGRIEKATTKVRVH